MPKRLLPAIAASMGAATGAGLAMLSSLDGLGGIFLTAFGAAGGSLSWQMVKPKAEARAAAAALPPPAPPDILEALPAPVMLVDRDLRLRQTNGAAAALFGPAAVGSPLVAQIRAPDFLEAVEETVRDGAPRTLSFTYMRAKEARHISAHIRALGPVRSAITPAALVLFEDQTRARNLDQMRETFISNASHELRTPLASIIGFIETLQGPAREDGPARERFLALMGTQAERMRRLVDDLMSLSRIELSAHVRPEGRVDLGLLSHEIVAAMQPLAAKAGATLSAEAPDTGPMTRGDRDQIAQLLTNLIDNAVKYGGAGVTVTVSAARPAPEWPGMVGITVTDDGPGIERAHIPRLTERFYRVSASRSRAVGGTGLGLAIAKHILHRHRGDLDIRSTPSEGSAFTLWLPDERA